MNLGEIVLLFVVILSIGIGFFMSHREGILAIILRFAITYNITIVSLSLRLHRSGISSLAPHRTLGVGTKTDIKVTTRVQQ